MVPFGMSELREMGKKHPLLYPQTVLGIFMVITCLK